LTASERERRNWIVSDTLNDFVAAEVRAEIARRCTPREDLAKALDVSPATLGRRLAGDLPFTVNEVELVARFFDLPVAAFVIRQPGRERIPA
jgi:uncharacterized protein (DUF2384 family)